MSKNYTVYHLHSDNSLLDSATKFEMYLDKAVEYNMNAIAFSEHGSVFNWIKKKEETEKRGLKYIHAMEAYVTETIGEKVRDNYHMMFIAKNIDGVKELNKMSSKAYTKEDGHFYYDARLTIDEVMKTSENIMITTACLGGLFAKARRNNNFDLVAKFLDWCVNNKERVFLEIQYHNHHEQIEYNHWLYNQSKEHGLTLIAGTDTHSLDNKYAKARKILMQAKGMNFTDEDKFDLTFKSYDEVVKMFEWQNNKDNPVYDMDELKNIKPLPREVYIEAINFTNKMANMVEEFELDKSHKYPKLYNKSEERFKNLIKEGVKSRGVNRLNPNEKKKYFNRIKEEFEVYKNMGAIDYMLLQKNIIDWCKSQKIYVGYGRGSVTGSLIAYLLGITEMDSIKHNLSFYRFMNPERVGLADIDIDFPPSRRGEVIKYVSELEGVHFSEIITFNTIALKGAIREVGRALNFELPIVDEIAKNSHDENAINRYRNKYPELFEFVDLLNGTYVSVGSHPSGFVVSPISLEENVGTFYSKKSKYAVSQVNMKELDANNYVKLDMLGLDNVEVINETCEMANINRLTPDNINDEDEKVWNSMLESTLGCFQWESDTASSYYNRLFNPDTIDNIKKKNEDIKLIDLFAMGNGAIRPSGESYRDSLARGEFHDNGHKALNEFLSSTQGQLVFQEQISQFLTDFCGFTGGMADLVRRGLAKKVGTEKYIPQIKKGFLETMVKHYNETEENAEKIIEYFLKVIEDASNYGFSINHSQAYSYIGYVNAYLRYYHPLEFTTVLLNINEDNFDKTGKIYSYARSRNIKILPIEFGKSGSMYRFSKDEYAIYKGIASIKNMNSKIPDELLDLSHKKFDDFVDLLVSITEETSVNKTQMKILIQLNFFKKFGKNEYLLDIYNKFHDRYKKTHIDKTKEKRLAEIREYAETLDDESLPLKDQLFFEREYLGYIQTTFPDRKKSVGIILDIDKRRTPKIYLYMLKTGKGVMVKADKKRFYDKNNNDRLRIGDILDITKVEKKGRWGKIDGKWKQSKTEMENYIGSCKILKK